MVHHKYQEIASVRVTVIPHCPSIRILHSNIQLLTMLNILNIINGTARIMYTLTTHITILLSKTTDGCDSVIQTAAGVDPDLQAMPSRR